MHENQKFRAVQMSIKMMSENDSPNKHFTFIFRRNKLLSVGSNDYKKDHPFLNQYTRENLKINYGKKKMHSEPDAILKYKRYDLLNELKDCIFINVRINSNYELGKSKPCSACQSWLSLINYRKFYYTDGYEWPSKNLNRYIDKTKLMMNKSWMPNLFAEMI